MNKELKEQAREEFKLTMSIHSDERGRISERTLDNIADYWLSLIDKTVLHEQERIVKAVWEADDMFDRGESWSHGIREHLISLITNKSDINSNK